ncbi:MAG TPA: hypothetical protein VF545_03815 [Thermoleophilaceae bacterium]|jgi:hypothetical protein
MIEREEQDQQPDEVPTDEQLDVEGPNESTQPTDSPLGEEAAGEDAPAGG